MCSSYLRTWQTVFTKKFKQKEVFIDTGTCTELRVAKQDKKDRIMQRVWNLMFTFIGPPRFSRKKNVCYNSDMGSKEMNDPSFDFLYYFWLKNVYIFNISQLLS